MVEQNDWTVMIYMAGDNNLSIDMAYTLENLQKLSGKNISGNLNLFVHYENNSREVPPIYCDFSDLKEPIYQYTTGVLNKFSTSNPGRAADSSGINLVIDFVDWCVKRAKKKSDQNVQTKYALIFSGHTMGFLSFGLLTRESQPRALTLPDLQKGLKIVRDEIIQNKLDLLGFDSCVMSMLEVGQQFKTVAKTMIASEGSVPNAGWSYSEVLPTLFGSETDIKKMVGTFVQKYIEKQSKFSIGGVSVDMAAWDLDKLDQLTSSFELFSNSLINSIENENSIVFRQMRRILLSVHYDCQTYMLDQNIDLGDFCSLLMDELATLKMENDGELHSSLGKIEANCEKLLEQIDDCIILSGFCGGTYQFSTGISLFFPWSLPALEVSEKDYRQLDFINKCKAGKLWGKFLKTYLSTVSRRKGLQVSH